MFGKLKLGKIRINNFITFVNTHWETPVNFTVDHNIHVRLFYMMAKLLDLGAGRSQYPGPPLGGGGGTKWANS